MADCIAAMNPELWSVSFPGIPVPLEAWLSCITDGVENSVGLFQEDATVRIVVWIDDKMRSLRIKTRDDLQKIQSWLEPQLGEQRKAIRLAAEEAERKSRLPLPAYADVVQLLKSGKRVTTGGGRYSETYFMEGGTLRYEIFDEGYTEVRDGTEADLQQAIKYYPDTFRSLL